MGIFDIAEIKNTEYPKVDFDKEKVFNSRKMALLREKSLTI